MKRPTIKSWPADRAQQQQLVREIWQATGFTQQKLAIETGVNVRQLRHYMNGTRETPFLFAVGAWAFTVGKHNEHD